jgi:tetratricopeptide (TPR) repeat protein
MRRSIRKLATQRRWPTPSRAGEVVIALALMLALATPTRAAENDIHRVVDAFVGAMTSNDLGRYEAIADTPVSRLEFQDVKELVERSRCVEIHSYRRTIEKNDGTQATVILDVDASRWTRGALNRRMPVPGSWVLEIVCAANGCRIHSATTRERVVARRVTSAPEAEREQLVAEAALDEALFAPVLAGEAFSVKCPPGPEKKTRTLEIMVRARELARRSGDLAAESECVRNMAKITGMYVEDAIPLANESLDLAVRSGDADAIAAAMFTHGQSRRNDLGATVADLVNASSTLDQLRDPRVGLRALAMKAYYEIQAGLLRDGLRSAHQLREDARHYGWLEGEGSANNYLSLVHYVIGTTDLARTYLELAYRESVAARDARGQTYALNDMASCDFLAHDYDRAIQGFRRAIATFGPWLADSDQAGIRGGLIAALVASGRIPEADRELKEMMEIARGSLVPGAMIRVLTAQAEIRLAQGRPREAFAAVEAAFSRPNAERLLGEESLVWPAASVAGRALRRLGRTTEAIAWFRRAIADIEERRSRILASDDVALHYFEHKLDPYGELAELLVRRGDAAEALQLSERIRARALVTILEQGRVDVSTSMTQPEKERERDLNTRLAELNQKLSRARSRSGRTDHAPQPARERDYDRNLRSRLQTTSRGVDECVASRVPCARCRVPRSRA